MDLTRWRNSHGFGVHSPLGYDVAKRVVNLGKDYAYYAEREILLEAKKHKLPQSEAIHCIKLHRLVSLLQTRQVFLDAKPNCIIQTALIRAGIKITTAKPYDFSDPDRMTQCVTNRTLFLLRQSYTDEVITKLLNTPGNAIILYSSDPAEATKQLRQAIESGIVIEGNNCALAIAKEQTQPVEYRMNF